jgi:uncharacterized membrane-anchored protein YitT (DUF2179 family)
MERKSTFIKLAKQFILITIGTLIYSIAIAIFIDPNKLAPGGVTGVAVIISNLVNLKTGTLILLINIPIMLFGWWKFGIKFIISTMYVTFLSSFMINLMSEHIILKHGLLTNDMLLTCITGGALLGFGIAIVFKQGATTGGTDVIVKALRQKYKHIKTGTIFLTTDAFIIIASAIVFKNIQVALYATITVVVANVVLDLTLYGKDNAKLLYIISDNHVKIAKRIVDELEIGATYLKAEGAYTNFNKNVIMCVCRKYNYTKVREIIKEEDINAFFIVTNSTEVFGDGYKSHLSEEI